MFDSLDLAGLTPPFRCGSKHWLESKCDDNWSNIQNFYWTIYYFQ